MQIFLKQSTLDLQVKISKTNLQQFNQYKKGKEFFYYESWFRFLNCKIKVKINRKLKFDKNT